MVKKSVPTGQININPWEAILAEVKRSAYRAAWVDQRLEYELEQEDAALGHISLEASPAELEAARLAASKNVRAWLDQSREERKHLMNTSTKAVSLGLSERYIESVRAEGQLIARVVSRALSAAQMTPEQKALAMDELRDAMGEVSRELRARTESVALPVKSESV